MLNPNFLGVGFRVNEGVVVALVTCVAALAVDPTWSERMPPPRLSDPASIGSSVAMFLGRWPSSSSERGNLRLSSATPASSSPTSKALRGFLGS